MEKIIELGGRVVTLSDSSGYIYDEQGIDLEKLVFVKELKNIRRGRISEYAEQYQSAVYTPVNPSLGYNPLWDHKADCAFPCATQNEINDVDALHLVDNGIQLICEGANMPTTPDAVDIFHRPENFLRPRQGCQCRRGGCFRAGDGAKLHASFMAQKRSR